ncbi:hypothetical protein CDD82_1282 [Ophiocordyceps australis]|uniref:Mediator of RNA polymerase II transcription subunit 14 n=1 Tax=Ophiocordyceps australis TaxID=1399860 RepID=A0A2C5XCR6_9HYPO|nr:hypothetical protein CDD82_1282 [Ophiocordyceps australis]
MEPGGHQGTRTNHDRNGVNGSSAAAHAQQPRDAEDARPPPPDAKACLRMNDLPDDIVHITHGFVPLSLLLGRLAQVSHNSLQDKIAELAKMALPTTAVNGAPASPSADDVSTDNLRKKSSLASFAQDMHAKWLKALVITEWSRQSHHVSKLIDLKFHIDQQRMVYDAALDHMANIKRDLTYARMPSPDLKTALQVLSTGSAPWMPDANYIEPPPLTPEDQLKWIDDLNTLLALRLNLDDFDRLPHAFRHYHISSGRVTFKVEGEFELDLTIADEDFDKQFWFIDFRYDFCPAASSLPPSLMAYLEAHVNQILAHGGLAGCHHFLHEFVLTCKINELKRQALQLSRNLWSGTLVVEPLNRALAMQYWSARSAVTGTKNWILVAVSSGRQRDHGHGDTATWSSLVVKWYRDNQEVKNVCITLDAKVVSADSLLKQVVGRHIEFILNGIRDKLMEAPRRLSKASSVRVKTSLSDPAASYLVLQDGFKERVVLLLEPMTGACSLMPCSRLVTPFENQLNSSKLRAEDGVACLENVRCAMVEEELMRRGGLMGWFPRKPALSLDDIRWATKLHDWTRAVWFRNVGWDPDWFLVALLSLAGDEWWLLQVSEPTGPARNRDALGRASPVEFKAKLALGPGHADRWGQFWTHAGVLVTSIMVQSLDVAELQRNGIQCCIQNSGTQDDAPRGRQTRLVSSCVSLSAMFPSMVVGKHHKTASGPGMDSKDNIKSLSLMEAYTGARLVHRQAWADDSMVVTYKHLQIPPRPERGVGIFHEQVMVVDAVIKIDKSQLLKGLGATRCGDMAYIASQGTFIIRLRRALGQPMLKRIKSCIRVIDRLVTYIRALDRAKACIDGEVANIGRVMFRYGGAPKGQGESDSKQEQGQTRRPWRVLLDLSKDDIDVAVDNDSPHVAVEDFLRILVNKEEGIGALMVWLPASVAILQTIQTVSAAWRRSNGEERVRLRLTMKTVAWLSICYVIGAGTKQRRISFDVNLRADAAGPWWYIARSDAGANGEHPDDVGKALQAVWDGSGREWSGFGSSARGSPLCGVTPMLMAVDDAIGRVVGRVNTSGASAPADQHVVVLE